MPPEHNDDRVFTAANSEYAIGAIADGVGGHFGGGIAAEAALEVIQERFKRGEIFPLEETFSAAKDAISELSAKNSDLADMATTLTICILFGKTAAIGHVGDARAYHIRGTGLITRTVDQNEGAELVRQGVLSPEKAQRYRRRNALTSALSGKMEYKLHMKEFEVQAKDRLILLTDGAYSLIEKRELVALSSASGDLREFVDQLISTITARDPVDDFSCVAIEMV